MMISSYQAAALLIVAFGIINAECSSLTWGSWSACSRTCGLGQRVRKSLTGEYQETQSCNLGYCTVKFQLWNFRRCNVWSKCSKSCGGGVTTAIKCGRGKRISRSCNTFPCKEEKATEQCSNNGVPALYRPAENACCKPSYGQCGMINNSRKKSAAVAKFLWDDSQMFFPWSVVVKVGAERCGGVMISNKHVLTAASCVSKVIRNSDVDVLRGAAHKWYGNYAGDRKGVTDIIKPDGFKKHIPHKDNIAILVLDGEFSEQPVCMPRGEDIPAESTCVVADFETAHLGSIYLKHVGNDFTTAEFSDCEEHFENFNFPYINSNELLNPTKLACGWRTFDIANRPRTCKGTTGAPLLCQRCASCQWMLHGIVTYSDDSCYPKLRPALFTRTSFYEDWIKSKVDLQYADDAPKC